MTTRNVFRLLPDVPGGGRGGADAALASSWWQSQQMTALLYAGVGKQANGYRTCIWEHRDLKPPLFPCLTRFYLTAEVEQGQGNLLDLVAVSFDLFSHA